MGSSFGTGNPENTRVPFEVVGSSGELIPNRALIRKRCAEIRSNRTQPDPVPENLAIVLLRSPIADVQEYAVRSKAVREKVLKSPMLKCVLHAIGWVMGQPEDGTGITAEECCLAVGIQLSAYRHRFIKLCRDSLTDWQWEALREKCRCL